MKSSLIIIFVFLHFVLSGQSPWVDSVSLSIQKLPPNEQVRQLYKSAKAHTDINLRESNQIAKKGLAHAISLEDQDLIFDGYLVLGNLALDMSDFIAADSFFQMSMDLAEKMEHPHMLLKAKDAKAKYLSFTGKRLESNILYDEIIIAASELGDSLILARSYMSKGLNYERLAVYETAIQHYYKALAIYEATRDRFRMGIIHTNIGMALMRLKRNEESLAEFQTALKISEEENDIEGVMINTLNIGVTYQKVGDLDQAKKFFEQSLVTSKSIGSWYNIALITANLGTVAMTQGHYPMALGLLTRAFAIKDSLGLEQDFAHTLNSLAEVHHHLGNFDQALAKALEAEKWSLTFKKRDQLATSHRIQAEIQASMQNFPLAYEHMVRHKQISDSIYTEESDKAVSQLKIAHETTLKEKEIEELTTKNKRNKTAQLILIVVALLTLITGSSLIYALHMRRTRDRKVLAKERELHELQNRFFANISHEFRTPLTLILGPVHNLKRQFAGTKEEGVLRTIQKNAERLLLLINQILDLAKFDMKVLELKKEPANLTRMIQGICSSFDSLAESRHIDYSYEVDPEMVAVADIRRLEIVLMNLISNAFKFTPDKGNIGVTAGISEDHQTMVMRVADSGSGISRENLSKIFDRYFHDDREAHSDFEGAGIGLALSKQIVEMHGGKISVTSKLNEGSVFAVQLPYEEVIKSESGAIHLLTSFYDTQNQESISTINAHSPASNKNLPIVLLVEDRADMREYITSLLRDNYNVIEAKDAFEGRTLAIEHTPDIVISDVMMPRKSGLELCRELKSDVRTSHIPVLLLTAKSSPEDRLSGLETEADLYLTKPFIPQELELVLHNLITSRKKIRSFYEVHHRIEPAKMSFNSIDEQFLQSFISQLEANYEDETFGVEQLSELMNLSRSQLHRKLTALTGQPPNKLIRTYRLKKAYDLVSSNAATMAEISYRTGFGSPAYFNKCFLEEFGETPGDVRHRMSKV